MRSDQNYLDRMPLMEFYQPTSSSSPTSNGKPPGAGYTHTPAARAGHGPTTVIALPPPDDLDLTQLGMMESLARSKGMTLTSYLDFLKAHQQTSQARSKQTSNTRPPPSTLPLSSGGETTGWSSGSSHAATRAFGRSEYGHVSNPESHDAAYLLPWSDSMYQAGPPSQHHGALETLQFTDVPRPQPSSRMQNPVQPPPPSQTYRETYPQSTAAGFGGWMDLPCTNQWLSSRYGAEQSVSEPLSEPQAGDDWMDLPYTNQWLSSGYGAEQSVSEPLSEPQVGDDYYNASNLQAFPQQGNATALLSSRELDQAYHTADNAYRGPLVAKLQDSTGPPSYQSNQSPQRPKLLTPTIARDNSFNTEGSSSSNSSWVITTPPSEKNVNVDSGSSSDGPKTRTLNSDPLTGPCRYDWKLPKRGRRSKKDPAVAEKSKQSGSQSSNSGSEGPKRRSPFQDPQMRESTARTRKDLACHRCRKQKRRCVPDPQNPLGKCLTCKAASPTLSKLPCLRMKVTEAISLYREQEAPNRIWTRRWKDFTIQNITEWASTRVRTIRITQGIENSSYELEVREFIPMQGDLMEKFWTVDGIRKAVTIPPYAIIDLEKAAKARLQFVNDNVGIYVTGGIDNSKDLLRNTYERAMRHVKEAPREEERRLLRDALLLWVAVRMSSTTEWICGDDHLGMLPVTDASSPYWQHMPIPPVMSAQGQIIAYSKILKPLKESVVKQLSNMGSAGDARKCWFTIYLTYFVLLHSCALVTRRNEEYARQTNAKTRYANPQAITDSHQGANVLLVHFHHSNKGQLPFALAENSDNPKEFEIVADLNEDQVLFMRNTAFVVRGMRDEIANIREEREFGDDYYFISQLYDEKWESLPIAE